MTINLADLVTPGHLILGLYGGVATGGAGVTGVALQVYGPGFAPETFSHAADAIAGFTNQAFDLGALGTSGVLYLNIELDVQTNAPGAGFYGDFILGEAPNPLPGIAHS